MEAHPKRRTSRNVVCVIPARGGSKGISGKNLRAVAGKPLIRWSIEHALNSSVNDVVVSSDSEEILREALQQGAHVIRRPDPMAQDWSRIEAAVKHAIARYEYSMVVMLQPTSPIRRPNDIDLAIKLFLDSGADCVFSACASHQFAWLERKSGGYDRIVYDKEYRPPREEVRPIIHENGSIYVSKAENYLVYNDRLHGACVPFIQPWICGLEIDTLKDLKTADWILR